MDPRRIIQYLEPERVKRRQHEAALREDAIRFPSPWMVMLRRLYELYEPVIQRERWATLQRLGWLD